MSWTDERVELLRKLWLEGLSASQIARELANGISRNAVIGKVHRLGMSGRVKVAAPTVARPRPKVARPAAHQRPSAPMVRGNTALAIRPQPSAAILPAPEEDVVIPMSEMVTIMDLKESMCRWPVGDPASGEFRFCGAKKGVNQSGPYCTYHSRVAYQPVQDRRRERRAQSA
ncbi:MAG: GcrA family cell cycle regulator [Methylovirgula sp.]|nr:GcrA family cell cycle regulator [Methylovirgula sp.]